MTTNRKVKNVLSFLLIVLFIQGTLVYYNFNYLDIIYFLILLIFIVKYILIIKRSG
jgi:hypothetical protein